MVMENKNSSVEDWSDDEKEDRSKANKRKRRVFFFYIFMIYKLSIYFDSV